MKKNCLSQNVNTSPAFRHLRSGKRVYQQKPLIEKNLTDESDTNVSNERDIDNEPSPVLASPILNNISDSSPCQTTDNSPDLTDFLLSANLFSIYETLNDQQVDMETLVNVTCI